MGAKPVMGGFAYNLDQGLHHRSLKPLSPQRRSRLADTSGPQHWSRRVGCEPRAEQTKQFDANGDPSRRPGDYSQLATSKITQSGATWFAVNAHAYAGLRAIADVLAEINHPAADDLQHEAEAYRVTSAPQPVRAMALTPVVRLPGWYLCSPHPHAYRTARPGTRLWFREAAWSPPQWRAASSTLMSQEMTWLLKDLEDNLFVTRSGVRSSVDLDERWFSHGGVTIQANLMDLAIDYLRRGEVEARPEGPVQQLQERLSTLMCAPSRSILSQRSAKALGPFYKSSARAPAKLRHMLPPRREWDTPCHPGCIQKPGSPQNSPSAWKRWRPYFGAVSFEVRPSVLRTTVTLRRDPETTRAPGCFLQSSFTCTITRLKPP